MFGIHLSFFADANCQHCLESNKGGRLGQALRYLLAQICQYYEAMKRSSHVALSFLSRMHSVLSVSVRHLTAVSDALLLVPDNVGKMVFPGVILKDLMIVINEVQDLLDHVTLFSGSPNISLVSERKTDNP